MTVNISVIMYMRRLTYSPLYTCLYTYIYLHTYTQTHTNWEEPDPVPQTQKIIKNPLTVLTPET